MREINLTDLSFAGYATVGIVCQLPRPLDTPKRPEKSKIPGAMAGMERGL